MNDATAALRELGAPWLGGERVKTVIDRASRRAGMSYSRAYEIWYGRARRIEEFERAAIAEALDKKRREATHNELHELRFRLERLESLLVRTDPEFHRETVTQTRQQLRTLGGARRASDRPVD